MTSFQQLLSQKETIYGMFVNIPDPTVVELAKLAGMDFIRIDWEHKLIDPSQMLNIHYDKTNISSSHDIDRLTAVFGLADFESL